MCGVATFGCATRRCGRPGLLPGATASQLGEFLTRLMMMRAQNQTTTIAIEAGLTGPIATDGLSSAPINTNETTRTTSSASSTGISEPTR